MCPAGTVNPGNLMIDIAFHKSEQVLAAVLLIAVTVLTRKVVVMDLEAKGDPALHMLGLAAFLGVLVGGYYLVKRAGMDKPTAASRD